VLAERLRAVGIETHEELIKVGDTAAFARIRKSLPDDACVSTRLALAGAVRGVRWFGLDKKLRTNSAPKRAARPADPPSPPSHR
jgi:DNA transformation protein and related proteins